MKRYGSLLLGIGLLLTGTAGLMSGYGSGWALSGMMGRMPPGIDPAELPQPQSPGAQVLRRYCRQCHNLPGPKMHAAQDWPAVVARMVERMEAMSGRGMMAMMHRLRVPSETEVAVLLAYLRDNAQRSLDRSRSADLDSPDGRAFAATCSRCHALPDPTQHTADEWPAVVQRMVGNMKTMGKTVPDDATLAQVLRYLQTHAG